MPKTIYFVRHAERIDVADATWLPTAERPWDPPLTEKGRKQAELTGIFLSRFPIKRIFSSPFLRCLETAHQIALKCSHIYNNSTTTNGYSNDESHNGTTNNNTGSIDVTVNVEEGITEFMCKAYFDKQPEYLHPQDVVLACTHVNLYYQSMMKVFYPEQIDQMITRYSTSIRNICKMLSEDEHAVVVTHGYGIQCMVEALVPSVTIVETPYCCLSIVTEETNKGGFRAITVTDDSHLKNLK